MWNEHFSKDKFISTIYSNVPSLKNVRIEKIEISSEGDKITIGFDLPIFPDKPPIIIFVNKTAIAQTNVLTEKGFRTNP
ncbi:hypothetical protein [Bacillus sp. MUM 116]|uniref:hypothetical protein n=1 Tax=Bacillus sp. MUM 116 TaxID=1678002 RepID=UPI00114D4342|nr:hypothetical protein [Bacillus sp. MUM 116]